MFWGNGQKQFILVEISVFRPKNARTKTYLSISLGGHYPRRVWCLGRQYLLADIVRGDTIR